MPAGFMISPIQFSIEIIATIIIAILAIIIFNKTKEISILSGKKSIQLFRYSFLFFGLAYIMRFLLMASSATIKLMDLSRYYNKTTMIFMVPLMVFFSLVAIMFLASSVIKKIQNKKNVNLWVMCSSLIIAILSFIFQSITLLILIELGLFIAVFTILIKQKKSRNKKRNSNFLFIYNSLFIAWILSIVILIPFRFKIPHETMLIPHILSIIIFSIILHKINKWIK